MFTASKSNRTSSKGMLWVTEAIALWLMCGGLCFAVFFLSDSWIPSIASFITVGVLVFGLRLTQERTMINRIILWGSAVLLAALTLVFLGPLQNETLIIINSSIDGWNLLTDSYVTHYATSASTFIGGVVIGVVGAIAVTLVASVLMPLHARLFTALIAGAGATFNLLSIHPSMAVVSSILIGWLGLWSIHSRRNVLRATPSLTAMAVAFVCLLIPSMALMNYVGTPAVSGISTSIAAAVDTARYGEDSLPQGDLYDAADMVSDDSTNTQVNPTRLQVTFGSEADIAPLYMRGFTGAVYNGSSWKPLSRSAYSGEWDGLFRWLEEGGFDQTYQAGAYQALDDTQMGRDTRNGVVSVANVGAYRKYTYTPYGTNSLEDTGSHTLLDRYLAGEGLSGDADYSAVVTSGVPETLLYTPSDWVKVADGTQDSAEGSFVRAERVYKSFVEQKYLTIDDTQKDFIDRMFYGSDWDTAQDDNIFVLTTRIRSVLESRCSVTDNPATLPANTDYIRWFMNSVKEGNSAAFASTAVMAYRQAGIPARYAEGYVLTQRDAQALAAAGQTQTQLTGHDSHAWVEIYLDGIGWMPVEVTPGFYQANYTTDQVIDVPREVAGDGSDDPATGSVQSEQGGGEQEGGESFDFPGLLLCIALGLLLLVLAGSLALLVQRVIRLSLHRHRIVKAFKSAPADHDFTRWLYSRFQKHLAQAGVTVDPDRPMECIDTIPAVAPDIDVNEVTRALTRFQSCLFGASSLRAADIRFICEVCCRLQKSNLKTTTLFRNHLLCITDVYGLEHEYALDVMQGQAR